MKRLLISTIICFPFISFSQSDLKLWYNQPATQWTEALPLGNGRIGAMVFGNTGDELIQMNESNLWSGGPVKDNVNPNAKNYLQPLRDALLKEEDYQKAIELAKKMQGVFTESYMPLGDIKIHQQFKDSSSAFYRELNLDSAVCNTYFTADGNHFSRRFFVSIPDQVMVIKLQSKEPKALSIIISTASQLHYTVKVAAKNELILFGKAPAHVDPSYYDVNKTPVIYNDSTGCSGMRFQMRIRIIKQDGEINTNTSGISISNASNVVLLVSEATSFNGFDKCPDKDGRDENALALSYLNNASKKSYDELLRDHVAQYQKLFKRVSFVIKDTSKNSYVNLPTDQRLNGYSKGAYDPGVEMLYFQYSRYLMISSSQSGSQPANLQGIWNKDIRPPWSSNYTININTEMNYWPVEVTNLSECTLPLFGLIKELSVTGAATAKEFYNMNGWTAHHNTDIWALSNPVGAFGWGDPRWANWPMGGTWLCQSLYEHFRFTNDTTFLRDTAYPLMKGAAEFCLKWLLKDSSGYYITAPAVSPENGFRYAANKEGSVSVATTMDMSLIWDLFGNIIEASAILKTDKNLQNELIAKRSKLYPLHVGRQGNLQEWNKDREDVEVHHRHVSHLFGLYPGKEISPLINAKFSDAAKKTLEIRGDESTGWSKAWKICLWARLLDGNHAYNLLKDLLHATNDSGYNYREGGGTYPNFFDAHPPFQIDGNFGGIAGMAEMLLQSQLNEIYLLPALPDAWKTGEVKGLKARGNFEISITWKDHKLTAASIQSISGGVCKIRTNQPVYVNGIHTKSVRDNNSFLITFNTEKNKVYNITP